MTMAGTPADQPTVPTGGIPFGRGALYYLLSNHFYIGDVKYKNEILPGAAYDRGSRAV
jgi:hypothetical protein